MSGLYRPIAQLPLYLANQIAAGEVVERPASVVKELLENSIDAGATCITIEVDAGGMRCIMIQDNGHGIPKQDLGLALMPHATSKIVNTEDLAAIGTLGFRGEALASIQAVSKLVFISCFADEKLNPDKSAWQVNIENDKAIIIPAACNPGTRIEVRDLFYNIPARRRFLKTIKTEFQYIEEVVKRIALSKQDINIILKHNSKLVKHFLPAKNKENLKSRVSAVCGKFFIENSVFFEIERVGLTLSGYLGLSEASKRTSDGQYFFVNGRMIKDKLINHAIKSVYLEKNKLEAGLYPAYVLFLTLSPQEVDVNVHPTKHEVRFAEPRFIHDFISSHVSIILEQELLKDQDTQEDQENKQETKLVPEPVPTFIQERDFIYSQQMDIPVDINIAGNRSTAFGLGDNIAERFELASLDKQTGEIQKKKISSPVVTTKQVVDKMADGLMFDKYYLSVRDSKLVIVDIGQLAPLLTVFYFESGLFVPETQPLLFARVMTFEKNILNLGIESAQEILEKLGFLYRINNSHQLALLQVPVIFKVVDFKQCFEIALQAVENKISIISALSDLVKRQGLMALNLSTRRELITAFLAQCSDDLTAGVYAYTPEALSAILFHHK